MAENDARPDALEDGQQIRRTVTLADALVQLLNPVSFTVLLILVSVLMLIAANVLGWDSGRVLTRMAEHEFARGLITYLFAVTTIGTSVVLVLAALTGKLVKDEAYQRGKEILALLLGVFGTIVGFYFGSEAHADVQSLGPLTVSPLLLSAAAAAPGTSVHVTAFVSGGDAPYVFAVATDPKAEFDYQTPVGANGWIGTDVQIPADASGQIKLRLGVRDSAGASAVKESVITIRGPGLP